MNVQLQISKRLFETVISHLLPAHISSEQAAFLFSDFQTGTHGLTIHVRDAYLANSRDFASQDDDYLALADEVRAKIIKMAHQTNACIAEMHSHPGAFKACFSQFDIDGLRETVPHMQWRLPRRPYIAIVVAPRNFDALVWPEGEEHPVPLNAIAVGAKLLRPTNLSMNEWR